MTKAEIIKLVSDRIVELELQLKEMEGRTFMTAKKYYTNEWLIINKQLYKHITGLSF